MLTVYLAALAFGLVLIGASVFQGDGGGHDSGDGDGDAGHGDGQGKGTATPTTARFSRTSSPSVSGPTPSAHSE